MAIVPFEDWNPSIANQRIIAHTKQITRDFLNMGYSMSLRQVYYQLVKRKIIENGMRPYKNLSPTLSRARLAGRLDWDALEDRSRNLHGLTYSKSIEGFLNESINNFWIDHWATQSVRVELWIEKDALKNIIADVCDKYYVDFVSCNGYASLSLLKDAADRFNAYAAKGQKTILLYLGDHDPSGLDMTRDIERRLNLMQARNFEIERVGLNFEQIQELNLPPNPTKTFDSRAPRYVAKYGENCWELDALPPDKLASLAQQAIVKHLDMKAFNMADEKEAESRAQLKAVFSRFEQMLDFANTFSPEDDPESLGEQLDSLESDTLLYAKLAKDNEAEANENARAAQAAIDELQTEKAQRAAEVTNLSKRHYKDELDFELGATYTLGKTSRIYRGATANYILFSSPTSENKIVGGDREKLIKFFEGATKL